MNSYLNKNAIYFELAFTLHTWFIIAVGDDDIIDLICCWAGCYLCVISFSFLLHQLVWNPGRVFPHQRRTVAEFSPTLFTCGDQQGGWSEDRRQMEATGSYSQVQVEMLGEFLPDVAESVKQFIKLVWNCQSACSYISLLEIYCNQLMTNNLCNQCTSKC